MQPKSKFVYFLGYLALFAVLYFIWQVPAIKSWIGGTPA